LSESVFVVASRSQHLLLVPWLVLILIWPRQGASWTRARICTALVTLVVAAAAKETWVVTPGLVFALELERRLPVRRALRSAILVGIAVVVYMISYAVAFGSGNPYFEFGWHLIAKIPAQLAAFLYLEEPVSLLVSLSWRGVFAVAVVASMAVACIRWRVAGTWVALALLILPTVPTLAVPFMPVRYLVIPYAGFLILVAGWLRGLRDRLPNLRALVGAGALGLGALTFAGGAAIVRADLQDYRAMAEAHGRLIEEARAVASLVEAEERVAVIRDENLQPLVEILRQPRGFVKLPYTRHAASYGLIDAAVLFEWVIAREDTRVAAVTDWQQSCRGVCGRLLVHIEGGFTDLGRTSDLAAAASRWQETGRRVQVIRVVRMHRGWIAPIQRLFHRSTERAATPDPHELHGSPRMSLAVGKRDVLVVAADTGRTLRTEADPASVP
jgi:hypothetical protein